MGGVGILAAGVAGALVYFVYKSEDKAIAELKRLGQPQIRKEKVDGKDLQVIEFEYFNALIWSIRQILLNRDTSKKDVIR